MPDHPSPILQRLFQGVGASTFLEDSWPQKTFHQHGNASRLPPLFKSPLLKDIQALASQYRGPTFYFAGESGAMRPIDRPALQLYRDGRTIYFGNVEPFVEGATAFLRAFERELGVNPGCARIGVFASPQNDGATTHYDTNEVFSIQIAGNKKFHIAPLAELSYPAGMQYSRATKPEKSHFPQMQNGFPDPANAEFECVEMEPGSVLFMPRGTWHYTSATSSDSIAASIIIDPPLAVDLVLDHLKLTLMQDQKWREPILGCWNNTDISGETQLKIDNLIDDMRSVVENLNADSIIRNAGSSDIWLEKINPDTRFQTIPTASMEFKDMEGHCQVTIRVNDLSQGDRITGTVRIEGGIKAVLEWILERKQPFTARHLATVFGANATELLGLLHGLCVSEVLMPLWYEDIS